MRTEWDYTELADAYLERPPYAESALDMLCSIASIKQGSWICDIGAGVGHLTIPLADRGYNVISIEPNDSMRSNGLRQTGNFKTVHWVEATGTETGQLANAFDFVSFGSSFNVLDRRLALEETYRILRSGKWFACLWNHRDLEDPVQKAIETKIREVIPDYDYGTRREDQTDVINASGLFDSVQLVTGTLVHRQNVKSVVEAWRSHATLHRQAGDLFSGIIKGIEMYLNSLGVESIDVPYITRAWAARRKD